MVSLLWWMRTDRDLTARAASDQLGPILLRPRNRPNQEHTCRCSPRRNSFTLVELSTCNLQVDQKYLAPRHARLNESRIPRWYSSNECFQRHEPISWSAARCESDICIAGGDWFEIPASPKYSRSKKSDEMRLAAPRDHGDPRRRTA